MLELLAKILEKRSAILLVLGAVFILASAVGQVPVGNQANLHIELAWRYFIAAIGVILLALGLVLAWKEPNRPTTSGIDGKTIEKLGDKEFQQYFLRRLREAKHSVSDLTYEDSLIDTGKATFFPTSDHRDEYLHIVEEISKRVKYREIIMFKGRRTRVEKARRLIAHAGEYYQLAGFTDLPQGAPPRKNFIIIDDEVILEPMVIRQADMVEYFRNFYDQLWRAARPIKVSTEIDYGLIEAAERKLEQTEKAT